MKKIALFMALASLLSCNLHAMKYETPISPDHALPNTNLRVIGLVAAGGGILFVFTALLKNLIDKVFEENTGASEATLKEKVISAVRYTLGCSTAVAGMLVGLYTIANANTPHFLLFNKTPSIPAVS